MATITDDELVRYYKSMLVRVTTLGTPQSFSNPASRWVGRQTAVTDLNVVCELNGIISAIETGDKIKTIDIDSYRKKILDAKERMEEVKIPHFDIIKKDGKFVKVPKDMGIGIMKQDRHELIEVMMGLNNEFQTKKGLVMRELEGRIKGMTTIEG